MPSVQIKVQDSARVRRQAKKATDTTAAMEELASVAEYVRSVAYTLAPKNTSEGAQNIHVEPTELGFAVVSPDLHMYIQEFGRTPGATQPSIEDIRPWGYSHGFITRASLFLLARSIGRNGIRAKRFMSRAAQAGRTKLDDATKRIAIRIEREWADDGGGGD